MGRYSNRTSKKTYAYTTGTLGTVQSTQTYTYGDSTWGDRLTAYNGASITYDDIVRATQEAVEKIVPINSNVFIVDQKVEKYYESDTDTYYLKVLIKYEIDGVYGANGYLYELNKSTY